MFRGYCFPAAVTFVYLHNSLWSLLWVGTCDLVKGQTEDWGSSSCNLKLRPLGHKARAGLVAQP